ncbi:MAG: hypothetical protein WAZ19_02305 [Anaerolineae bacterium]
MTAVVVENYYYIADDFIAYIKGVFDDKCLAIDIVRREYDLNPALELIEDNGQDLWYKTRTGEQINIIFEEFELNKLR